MAGTVPVRSVGITGHRLLTPSSRRQVALSIATTLGELPYASVGLTSLAIGADQIFAHLMLAVGGEIVFVQPCEQIESTFDSDDVPGFRALAGLSAESVAMPFTEPAEDAYLAAGHYVADHCDLLLAVWDGAPAHGRGGTGDVVEYRRSLSRPVRVIWPDGARRA